MMLLILLRMMFFFIFFMQTNHFSQGYLEIITPRYTLAYS